MITDTPVPAAPPDDQRPLFISADWGTTSFRLRVIGNSVVRPVVLAALNPHAGIAATHTEWERSGLPPAERVGFYRSVLERAIGELGAPDAGQLGPAGASAHWLRGIPVIVSGMASSSIGMLELPYRPLPFAISGVDLPPTLLLPTVGSPRTIGLLPGVCSADDVMRGEETQLIGCGIADGFPDAAAASQRVFLFPGTHSKHITVSQGQAVAFKTYMTGEIFALLARQSILAGSVAAHGGPLSMAPFQAGVAAARHSGLLHNAFLTRTNILFSKYSKEDNYHFLSGLLIGEELSELAAGDRTAVSGIPPVTLVAASPLKESYAAALDWLGFKDVAVIDADDALVAGHCVLFALFGAAFAP
jgi:2-dehydro-3-deoxygalactonokinase